MDKKKKLKDLKKGYRMWLHDFTDTTPIYVEKKVRQGGLMIITLRWDTSEYECYGPALGWTCVGYNKGFGQELVFTCDFDSAWEKEKKRSRLLGIISQIKELEG